MQGGWHRDCGPVCGGFQGTPTTTTVALCRGPGRAAGWCHVACSPGTYRFQPLGSDHCQILIRRTDRYCLRLEELQRNCTAENGRAGTDRLEGPALLGRPLDRNLDSAALQRIGNSNPI